MTPEQRLLKAFELSEFSRQLFKAGLRDRFPEKTEAELHNLVVSKAIQKSAIKLQLQTQWQQLVDQAEPY
jgi:hypothetical protein